METNTTPTYTHEIYDRDEIIFAEWIDVTIACEPARYTVIPCPNPACEWSVKVWAEDAHKDHACHECEDGAILMTWDH